jgi:hypothetical protein
MDCHPCHSMEIHLHSRVTEEEAHSGHVIISFPLTARDVHILGKS